MQVSEVKDVRWPNELLQYSGLLTQKAPSRVGYVTTSKNDLAKCITTFPVASYLELQELVSRIAALNGRYMPFLRGQSNQYFLEDLSYGTSGPGVHSLKPGLWRIEESKRQGEIDRLLVMSEVLRAKISGSREFEQTIKDSLKANPLVSWAIIQHYGDVLNCSTPMLDLTRSLHVACHFALQKNGHGYIYVLGLPWPTERFSTSVEDGIVMASLLGATPCAARRPLAQDGYLMCTSDYWKILARADDDVIGAMEGQFHRRILAVIEIDGRRDFWSGSPVNPINNQYEPEDDRFRFFLTRTVLPEVERRMAATRR